MNPSSSQSPNDFHLRRKTEKKNCSICDDIGDGCHFGAEACRACAAFFRRTVALGKEYECRQQGYCTVNSIVRSICKSCRLKKCLEVGMKSSCVQPKRDKKKEEEQINHFEFSYPNESGPSTSEMPSIPSLDSMPIFARMKECYEKLENSRNVVHRIEGDNIFEKKTPRALNFRVTLEMSSKEVSLVADWIEWCFEEFRHLPTEQKNLLFLNFVPLFIILERAYLTSKYGEKNQLILPSRDYVQTDKLEEFFTDTELGICGKKLATLFEPSVQLNETFHELLRAERVELYDFFALTVSLFWDHGLVGQTEECSNIARKMKLDIVKEYTYYLKHFKGEEDPIGQMALKISILTALQRVSHRFREDMSLAHIFDVYTIPSNVSTVLFGKIS
ncbi:hypothetical protein GCK72_018426 [Caenorhabditis remanei]|uniref:Uncharacterized protein n=1 Tax=Caenorhabditis remanei TaxID=31234 RepID=A0A6A5GBS0_CAERE|nr:hypothetical protein GCK72_018426 [Caenorhabditis remanei]KAF1751872.1 hypothetical protein GCK72_018426 [Caenorhabditis remanei]